MSECIHDDCNFNSAKDGLCAGHYAAARMEEKAKEKVVEEQGEADKLKCKECGKKAEEDSRFVKSKVLCNTCNAKAHYRKNQSKNKEKPTEKKKPVKAKAKAKTKKSPSPQAAGRVTPPTGGEEGKGNGIDADLPAHTSTGSARTADEEQTIETGFETYIQNSVLKPVAHSILSEALPHALIVDFTDYPELYEELKRLAKADIRTPEHELLHIIEAIKNKQLVAADGQGYYPLEA